MLWFFETSYIYAEIHEKNSKYGKIKPVIINDIINSMKWNKRLKHVYIVKFNIAEVSKVIGTIGIC